MPDVGERAPDFELRDQTGQPVRLSDFHGKKAVVLVFYPFAFTNTCRGELCDVRDHIEAFRTDRVETMAVSVDPSWAQRAWAEQQGFDFPLLSDFWPHGEVARRYGVFDDTLGVALRATFVIDVDGTVRYTEQHDLGQARDHERWQVALRNIGVA